MRAYYRGRKRLHQFTTYETLYYDRTELDLAYYRITNTMGAALLHDARALHDIYCLSHGTLSDDYDVWSIA